MSDWEGFKSYNWYNLNWSLCGIVAVAREHGCFFPCCRGTIRFVPAVILLRRLQFRAFRRDSSQTIY